MASKLMMVVANGQQGRGSGSNRASPVSQSTGGEKFCARLRLFADRSSTLDSRASSIRTDHTECSKSNQF